MIWQLDGTLLFPNRVGVTNTPPLSLGTIYQRIYRTLYLSDAGRSRHSCHFMHPRSCIYPTIRMGSSSRYLYGMPPLLPPALHTIATWLGLTIRAGNCVIA